MVGGETLGASASEPAGFNVISPHRERVEIKTSNRHAFIVMPTIIGIPLHIIIIGMPIAIIVVMRSHIAVIMSMVMPAVGIILQTMPSAVISQVIAQQGVGIIIGIIMPLFIIGMVIPFIIGIIMPFIIGICIVVVGICIAVIMIVPLFSSSGPSVRPLS
ncbi:hypothetical protein [Magnetospirillum molischianum]|uniref:Uncharacterized protein n=1 Tax=Magnetospirillum molischianum DSM 120 TaxID=1150626 RepID=H8FRY0_MAGML|nr:hypothetical protein [Magnetospirillum molischianum]CCG41118.1 membrane hypothetical protein [Magnetospirillum molischianum DSM 120]